MTHRYAWLSTSRPSLARSWATRASSPLTSPLASCVLSLVVPSGQPSFLFEALHVYSKMSLQAAKQAGQVPVADAKRHRHHKHRSARPAPQALRHEGVEPSRVDTGRLDREPSLCLEQRWRGILPDPVARYLLQGSRCDEQPLCRRCQAACFARASERGVRPASAGSEYVRLARPFHRWHSGTGHGT